MMIYRIILFLFLLPISAIAQEPYAIKLDEQQGLPSNTVYNIFHDKQGFTWIATEDGLSRYDGFNFKTYTNPTQTSIPGSNIKQDKYGRIWYQNFDGYCYYVENDSLKSLQQSTPINYNPIGLSSKYLFILQSKGVDVFDLKTLKKTKSIVLPFPIYNLQHSECFNEVFYFIENFTLYKLDDKLVLEKVCGIPLTPIVSVTLLATEHNKPIVIERNPRTNKLNYTDTIGKIHSVNIPENMLIHGTKQIRDYHIIYGNKGILVYRNNQLLYHWFKEMAVTSLSKDYVGNYWISTLNKGLIIIPNLDNYFISIEGEPTRIISYAKGHYIFNKAGQINHYNTDFTAKKLISKNETNPIYYAYFDEENKLVFTSSLGMNVFNLNQSKNNHHTTYALKEVCKINTTYLALAINGQALLYKTNKTQTNSVWDSLYQTLEPGVFPEVKKLIVNYRVKTIAYQKTSNAVFMGTNIGLFKRTPQKQIEVKQHGETIFAKQLAICKNKIYILTTRNKLYVTDNLSTYTLLNETPNISCENIAGIRLFNDSFLCVYGNNKLIVVDGHRPEKLLYESLTYIKTAEIKDLSFYNNTLYLLIDKGVIKLPVKTQTNQQIAPKFIVDNTTVNGINFPLHNATLNYAQNNINIKYAVLNYVGMGTNKLYYSLNHGSWEELPANSNTLQFAALNAGAYTIDFKLNNTLLPNSTLTFEIVSAWWKRWWFVILVLVVISSLAVAYYKWQVSVLHKSNALLKQNFALEKELNKSVLTAIKSQMNPHFFYNALNTIQAYIFTNDKTNAGTYLTKFSRLTRNILEMSDKDLITLDAEVESLDLYLSLEKMRFDGELNYSISVDKELQTESVKFPPMLIQPHIENAIKHGLLHKEGEKNLTITFTITSKNQLCVLIDDNGIGRKRSFELNSIKHHKHQSFSTEANQTRIELMNKLRNTRASLTITDKYDAQQRATGTTVTILLPFNF